MKPVHLGMKISVTFVAALLLMGGQATAQIVVTETTVAKKASTSPVEKDSTDQVEPTGLTGSSTILVSKQPIGVLAGPSSSAAILYGFPAGRRFRLIGHEAGFARIQDLKSGAVGW